MVLHRLPYWRSLADEQGVDMPCLRKYHVLPAAWQLGFPSGLSWLHYCTSWTSTAEPRARWQDYFTAEAYAPEEYTYYQARRSRTSQ